MCNAYAYTYLEDEVAGVVFVGTVVALLERSLLLLEQEVAEPQAALARRL